MLARGGIFSWGINFPVLAVGGNEKGIFHQNCILVFGGFFETAAKRIESGKGRRFNIGDGRDTEKQPFWSA